MLHCRERERSPDLDTEDTTIIIIILLLTWPDYRSKANDKSVITRAYLKYTTFPSSMTKIKRKHERVQSFYTCT